MTDSIVRNCHNTEEHSSPCRFNCGHKDGGGDEVRSFVICGKLNRRIFYVSDIPLHHGANARGLSWHQMLIPDDCPRVPVQKELFT